MAKERTSVRMQTQIKFMSEQGHSIRTIARVLRLSRRTVRKYLEPPAEPTGGGGGWEEKIDWEYVRQEVNGKGTTVKQIGREVAADIEYVKFWRVFRERVGPQGAGVTIRLQHKPGEKTQVDFCDGLFITDPMSGKKTLTQFFLGVLPFSSYTFGEFVFDQKLPSFIGVQERMFAYFGGVTSYLVVDNLKSGVQRADRYDPDVNPTYCDFANHMGFAVLPARPYKPRDKGSGESAIGVIQRDFFQEVRNQVFYSLVELNEAAPVFRTVKPSGDERLWGITGGSIRGREKAFKAAGLHAVRAKPVARRQSPSRLSCPGGEKLLLGAVCLCRPTDASPA